MKTKICIIITAIIFFTASELTAVEDKIFTSSGQILPGEEWSNVYIYNDDTIVDMLGGLVDSMGTYDASTLNVTGGYVSTLDAHEFSTVNVSGGYVHGLHALDHASVNFSGNAGAVALRAEDFGTVNMTGGIVDHISAYDSGTSNLYGGAIEYIFARNSSIVNIYGYDLVKTISGGSYGYGQVYGFWSDGTEFTIDLNGSETYSHINLFEVIYIEINIHPDTFNLQSKGKFMTCRMQLPEAYNVNDIDPGSILLERRVKAEWKWFNEKQNVVKAKFKRSELKEILEPGEIELIVSCHLLDGTYFVGTDTVKVIGKGRSHKGRVNSNSKVEDGIEYYIQTDKAVYNLGEEVEMLYRVTNLTDVSVNLGTLLPDPPDNYDLRIMQGNAQVWWYPYTAITAVIRDFILQPLETKEFQTTWDMMNDNGTPFQEYDDFFVTPGSYNVVGEVALSFGYERVPVSVSIEIIPGKKKR